MEYVTLGRTKEKVSRISLGTWSYGGPNTLSGDNPVGWSGQDDKDSTDAHMEDTIKTGCGLCKPDAVRYIVERGRARVDWLTSKGVSFTKRKSNCA